MSAFARARRPAVLVGPHADRESSTLRGPIVACLDGSTPSEAVLPVALAWARAFDQSVRIVTVAEPVPGPVDGHRHGRTFGPDGDADAYVDRLARAWQRDGVRVSGKAIYNALGPTEGIKEHLRTAPAALLAVTTHARTGFARAVIGSVTERLVHEIPVPVVVAPLTR